MKNKILKLLILLSITSLSYAQSNVIKKCTDLNGNIVYLNVDDLESANFKCKKTNLGEVTKINNTQQQNTSAINVPITKQNDLKIETSQNNKINLDFINALNAKKQQNEKKIENYKKIISDKKAIITKLSDKLNTMTNPDLIKVMNDEITYHKKEMALAESEMDVLVKENAMQIDIKLIEKVDGPKPPLSLPNN